MNDDKPVVGRITQLGGSPRPEQRPSPTTLIDKSLLASLREELAASQSRERVYREALEKIGEHGISVGYDDADDMREIARAALTNNKLDEEKE